MGPAVKHSPAARTHTQHQIRLWCFLGVTVLLSGCTTTPAAENYTPLFAHYEVFTGHARTQTVLTGHFLGGSTADLAVVYVDENHASRVQLFSFDGDTWSAVLDVPLSKDALFVDVVSIAGRDRLITYADGHLSWLDPESAAITELLEVATHYKTTHNLKGSATRPGAQIPHVDISRDLNRDGRDDLVIPDLDGFRISVQQGDGSFSAPAKLGPAEPFLDEQMTDEDRTYREVGITAGTAPVYLRRVYQMDYDRDGRSDLLFWNSDHFDVYRQLEHGNFDPAAMSASLDVPFDSDGAYSRVIDYQEQGAASLLFGFNERSSRTVLHSMHDLNGDGIADVVTQTTTGRTLIRQRSLYEVYFGVATTDGTQFASTADTAIRPGGKAGGMQPWGYSSQWFRDFDDDGRIDILFRDVDVDVGGMARAMVGNSVALELQFYRLDQGNYPAKPNTRRHVKRLAPLAGLGNVFLPPIQVGDINGDRRLDLLVGHSPGELQVFLGKTGPDFFERRPHKVTVEFPGDERRTRLADLNRDGKQDLLIHHPSETESHRLLILIAQ